MTLNPYVPIVGLLVLGALLALFSVSIAPIVGPKRYNRAKLEAYECGIEPAPQPIGGGRFPVRFVHIFRPHSTRQTLVRS